MMTLALAVASTLWAPPRTAPPDVALLIEASYAEEYVCGGSSDPDEIRVGCAAVQRTVKRLNELGWCYGQGATSDIDARWSRCINRRLVR